MKRYIEFLFFLITTQKKVLSNLFGAQIQGREIMLNYNTERFIIYVHGREQIEVFYAAELSPMEFWTIGNELKGDQASRINFTSEISMATAADLVKKTWKVRKLPPRIEPPLMFLLLLMAGVTIFQFIVALFVYGVRWLL